MLNIPGFNAGETTKEGDIVKKYQIKMTYLVGEYKGKSFVLTKGGYVAKDGFQLPEFCYSSERTAKAVVTRYKKQGGDGFKYEIIEVE